MDKKVELRGRPNNSPIRQNLIELLFHMRSGYGYNLYKKYLDVFNQKVSIRSIYYHLNKGVEIGEFVVKEIESVQGDYSWGNQVKRVVFSLGPNARPSRSTEVLDKIKLSEIKKSRQ